MAPILDEVMSTQKELDLQQFEPSRFVAELIEDLDERSKTIVHKRFGLDGSKPKTLESLGKQFNITRERVRQIESLTLRELRRGPNAKRIAHVSGLIHATLSEAGGVMEQEALLRSMLSEAEPTNDSASRQALLFLFNLSDEVEQFDETDRVKALWASNRAAYDRLTALLKTVEKTFEAAAKPLSWAELTAALKQTQSAGVPSDAELQAVLATSKRIAKNPYGEYGLVAWSNVVPKGVRDKAYLVLHRAEAPLHFLKITEGINAAKFDARKAFPQTVHNELIKDQRFVLVGRGTYALREWGYTPGTVADVLTEVLREHEGPMDRDELLAAVLKRRMVKRNTVLIGLQDKTRFTRVDRRTYALAEPASAPSS
ncbi:MAG: sigma factor-like helix-turn-helix DNA-binding protein [Candidatus Andersenbacteria bacterium]